jgi:hypothetical protein
MQYRNSLAFVVSKSKKINFLITAVKVLATLARIKRAQHMHIRRSRFLNSIIGMKI